ncbi:MAG TPA: hypothetical protein VHE78_05605, partial [Gemmatimonadaceae bacterium]|nr:hypothetical protein [Gemmatimonadaceae bacterium]
MRKHSAGKQVAMAHRARRAWFAISGATLVVATAGCGDITNLRQSNPGQLSAATLYVPGNAQLLVNGAISDFECAYSRYVVGTGILGDELINAISNTANFDYDRRTLPTNGAYGTNTCASGNQQPAIYSTLSTARGSADTVLAKLQGWTVAQVPNRTKLIGQAAAYAGYSLVLLGESMCSGAINVGPELTPVQLFNEAKLRFDAAIPAATTATDTATLNLALLGRARTQLDLGNAAAAATDAAAIPPTFVANMSTDPVNPRRQNFVFIATSQSFWASVDPSFRDLTIGGAPDPRVLVTNTAKNGTANIPIWTAN